MVAPIPAGWSYPGLYGPDHLPDRVLRARRVADLQPGECVLIHAAAGGVGIAAVQLAAHLGAEIFATASPAKWPHVGELGAIPPTASRTPAPARSNPSAAPPTAAASTWSSTRSTGELVDASLRLLPPADGSSRWARPTSATPTGPPTHSPVCRYQAFDLPAVAPERGARDAGRAAGPVQTGALTPPPITTWDVRRAPDAFRYLSQARQTGKIALTLPGAYGSRPGPC